MASMTRSQVEAILEKYRNSSRNPNIALKPYGLDGNHSTPNLDGVDLSELDMSMLDLSDWNLRGSKLTNTNLAGSWIRSLERAIINGTILCDKKGNNAYVRNGERTDFTGSIYRWEVFSSSQIKGAIIPNLDMSGQNFSGKTSLWDEVILPNINLTHTNLRSTLLIEAVMRDAVMYGTDLSPCDSGCSLNESDWNGTDLSGAVLTHAILDNAILNNTKWVNAVINSASMDGVYLNNADMRGVRFGKGVVLQNIIFNRADLRRADLSQVIIPNWLKPRSVGYNRIEGISFSGARMNKQTKLPPGFEQNCKDQIIWG